MAIVAGSLYTATEQSSSKEDWRIAREFCQQCDNSDCPSAPELSRFFCRQAGDWFFRARCRDQHDADENEQSSKDRTQAKRLVAEEESEQHRHDGVHLGVGADLVR